MIFTLIFLQSRSGVISITTDLNIPARLYSGVFEGRLTTYLKLQNNFHSNYKYYLCGSSEMVVECRDILISKGIPYDQIVAEIYF